MNPLLQHLHTATPPRASTRLADAAPATEAAAQAAAPEAPAATPEAGLPPDVARLFRRTLAEGRIHPLMPLLLRWRREQTP
jgi:hypothetical protein